jgi:hypothetical protein
MESPELGVMPDHEMTLAAVRCGEIPPSLAQKWVTNMGLEPFPSFSNLGAFDPMQEQEWTLPMAAAWFIWRSTDAVRDQWMPYRRAWLDSADTSNQVPLMEVSLRDLFAWADLRRFQIRPYRAYGSSSKEPLPKSNLYCSPRSRFQTALETEKINLTGIYFRDHLRRPIKSPRLKDQIEYLFRRRKMFRPDPKGPYYPVREKPGTPEFTDLHVYRDEVIGADEIASQADFDEPHWTLEHVLGWIAHRNPRRFRLVAPIELELSSKEWKMAYTSDFVDQYPEGSFRAAMMQGQLDEELDKRSLPRQFPNPIPREWWLERAMTKAPRMWFRRDQVLSLWPSHGHSTSFAAAEAGAPQATHLRLYSELPTMRSRIIDIARDLWSNKNFIPPIVEERDRQIRAEYLKRELSTKAPDPRTIRRAFQAIKSKDWEPWTKA